jgi:hypothetical protein
MQSSLWFLPRLQTLNRSISATAGLKGRKFSQDFTFFPNYLTLAEQKILLTTSLGILDSAESRQHQRWRRKIQGSSETSRTDNTASIQSIFLPDELYQFEEVIAGMPPIISLFHSSALTRENK